MKTTAEKKPYGKAYKRIIAKIARYLKAQEPKPACCVTFTRAK